jgi:hypothetical protein
MAKAFKEWAIVCEALGSGSQSILVRKGGIAEGREGFSFREREFYLFPTWHHEQLGKTQLPGGSTLPLHTESEIEIRYVACVEWTGLVTDWDAVRALASLHILSEAAVRKRFEYEGREGVHIAFVRAFRLDPPCRIANEKRYGGCRSWVDLPDFTGCAMVSVLTDEEHARRAEAVRRILHT